jgi:hypothetical protein
MSIKCMRKVNNINILRSIIISSWRISILYKDIALHVTKSKIIRNDIETKFVKPKLLAQTQAQVSPNST